MAIRTGKEKGFYFYVLIFFNFAALGLAMYNYKKLF